MVPTTISWMTVRLGSYRLVVHAIRYQTHHMARSSTCPE